MLIFLSEERERLFYAEVLTHPPNFFICIVCFVYLWCYLLLKESYYAQSTAIFSLPGWGSPWNVIFLSYYYKI